MCAGHGRAMGLSKTPQLIAAFVVHLQAARGRSSSGRSLQASTVPKAVKSQIKKILQRLAQTAFSPGRAPSSSTPVRFAVRRRRAESHRQSCRVSKWKYLAQGGFRRQPFGVPSPHGSRELRHSPPGGASRSQATESCRGDSSCRPTVVLTAMVQRPLAGGACAAENGVAPQGFATAHP